MDLRDRDVRFQLGIAGYEFPQITASKWDANWLLVETTLTIGEDTRRHVHPSVTAFELESALRWVEEIGRHHQALEAWTLPFEGRLCTAMTFTEPNLEFELRSGPPLLFRVYLGAESVPAWAARVLGARIEQDAESDPRAASRAGVERFGEDSEVSRVWLDIAVSAAELSAIAASFREALENFPVRRFTPAPNAGDDGRRA
jgi:hypothetical protein